VVDYEFKAEEQIKCPICGESANYREFPDIVRLLQPGEAYREMWGWLDNIINSYYGTKYERKLSTQQIREIIYDLEQKYFPKEVGNNGR